MSLQSRITERAMHLPPALTRDIGVHTKQRIPTPDGIDLLADVYLPRRLPDAPTVLVRTPYGRKGMVSRFTCRSFAERGYQLVVASVRGTDGSGGTFDPFLDDKKDGLATLEWIEAQPWYNGTLFLFGASYMGYFQFAMAPEAGDRIAAMFPMIATSRFGDTFQTGGSFLYASCLEWTARMVTSERSYLLADLKELKGDKRAHKALAHVPISENDRLGTGKRVAWWRQWMAIDGPRDLYWSNGRDHRPLIGNISAPTQHWTGWHDLFTNEQLDDYTAMRDAGLDPYITIGPWAHVDFELYGKGLREALDWFRAHQHEDRRGKRELPVRLYVQGAGEWRDYPSWPVPGMNPQPWSVQSDRGLARGTSSAGEPGRFRYDPADPTPSVGGAVLDPKSVGCKDNTELEARPDVLVYTSEPMRDGIEIIGPVSASVTLRTSIGHADVFVRVCDVDVNGRSTNVCDGIQRISPDRFPTDDAGVRTVAVRLWPTAYRFKAGHKIRLQVSGGAFPRFVRNHGTGVPPGSAVRMVPVDYEILPGTAVTLPMTPTR